MHIHLIINGDERPFDVAPNELLLTTLRRAGLYSVKHGCETGECGACALLLDGQLVNSCTLLAAQAHGRRIETVEGLAPELPGQRGETHPLQQAFIDTGAIQCGFCTPAQIMAAKALLDRQPDPSEAEVRAAIAGVLCRCTGYVRPVQAVLRAAATLRGETVLPVANPPMVNTFPSGMVPNDRFFEPDGAPEGDEPGPTGGGATDAVTDVRTRTTVMVVAPPQTKVVNKSEIKVDALKLAKGRAVFTDDMELPGMLYGALLTQPARPRPHPRDRHEGGRAPAWRACRADLQEHAACHVRRPADRATPSRRPSTRSAWTTRCVTTAIAWP